jgi:aspartate kinase
VQKFGGTSLGTTERINRAAYRVSQTIRNGEFPVVVASAMAGVTDNLVKLASLIKADRSDDEYDVIISAGEQISAGLFASALNRLGIRAKSMLSWQIPILARKCEESERSVLQCRSENVKKAIDDEIVPVIAGFQGVTNDGRLVIFGRGGSDLTAVAVAASIFAKRCDIFTDVEGVYTADPRLVPKSRKIPFISYELMLEMAEYGAKVLQEQSVSHAMENKVPVHVASSFNNNPGTMVGVCPASARSVAGITLRPSLNEQTEISIIGRDITSSKNVYTSVNEGLETLGINYAVSDGSINRISFIISDKHTEIALNKLHTVCGLDVKEQ